MLKPQSAFFEPFGSRGVAVLERTRRRVRGGRGAGLLDVKRGDIGSTMAATPRPTSTRTAALGADAITVSPYLGFGSLRPAFDLAAATGRASSCSR